MAPLRYDLATVAVFDPVAMNRTGSRNVLFGLGFRESDTELRAKFDAAITAMKEHGSLNVLLVEWFGEGVTIY